MTTGERFDTWREAYDHAREELAKPYYRDWAWAEVHKDEDGKWWALIA